MSEIDESLRRAAALRAQGRLKDAELIVREVLKGEPRHPYALDLLGMLAHQAGALEDAVGLFGVAVAEDPSEPVYEWHLALALKSSREMDAAQAALTRALAKLDALGRGQDPKVRNLAARLLTELGDFAAMRGRREDAVEQFRAALARDPDQVGIWYKIAIAERYEDLQHPDIAAMNEAAARPGLEAAQRAALHFALGRSLDRLGEYDRAFEQFQAANELRRERVLRDNEGVDQYVADCEQVFTRALLEAPPYAGNASELPVFVVGMPRSGTTLVEQIIASHSRAHGAGELGALLRLLGQAAGLAVQEHVPARFALEMSPQQAATVAEGYLAELTRGVEPGIVRITDKAPSNCYLAGYIALLFPQAKIIDCRREPLDNCLSMYFQPLPLSYDLTDLGRAYRRYERMMDHWHGVMPERLLRVQYEDTVEDPESTARAILDFAGLAWEEECLAFHRSRRAVQTMSLWQVREPVYTESVGRWRHYERHLGPLREALGIAPG